MFRLRRLHLSGDKSDVYANYDRYSGRAVDYQCLPSTDQVLEPQCDFGEGFTGAEHLRVYGWYLRELPPSVPAAECVNCNGLTLLYIGIAPRPPAKNGSISSRTLRTRLRQHYALNAEGSTLRLTLGCLLAQQLGIELRRVGSGQRMTFGAGEHVLSTWMDGNAFVAWLQHPAPWKIEGELIRELRPPLNLAENSHHSFYEELTRVRRQAKARARSLDVMPNGFEM